MIKSCKATLSYSNLLLIAFILMVSLSCCKKEGEDNEIEWDLEDEIVNPDPQMPFPQALNLAGTIKPNVIDQSQLNSTVADYYNYWKDKYIKPGVYVSNSFYVDGGNTGGSDSDKGTSEGHGWGMIIAALMAGHDDDAKVVFDGLVRMYNNTRSSMNSNLMAWLITENEDSGGEKSSATDGDMDIAYALLLAHEQWGSKGEFNYLNMANRMIKSGIKSDLIHSTSKRLMLGDWDSNAWSTRTSDWMAGHLRSYYHYTEEDIFMDAEATIYTLTSHITTNYSNDVGLLPDFVVDNPAKPADSSFLESDYDGAYNWNACRVPLRFAVDYAHNQTPEAKAFLSSMLSWLQVSTNGDITKAKPGYLLDGSPIPNRSWTSIAFTAPFVSACIVDCDHQDWLNQGWNYIADKKSGYYADTINLLSMLLISGNWWAPEYSSKLVTRKIRGS